MPKWIYRVNLRGGASVELRGTSVKVADRIIGVWDEEKEVRTWPLDDVVSIERRHGPDEQWSLFLRSEEDGA